ncbi:MAG: hypothetical protein OEY99_02130 [Aigarchaeota archaeon]|nr:hypothetical protein [Aigarchaeota archaeon]
MSESRYGYAGKLLRVDLTHERMADVVFDEDILRKYVGGTGIGAKILYEEVPPDLEWSDSENRMVFASGPLGGTRVGGSGTFSLVTKGALTGGATATQANGYFGAYLKLSGYDGIIIQGRARRWLYLHIQNGQSELRDANHLVGVDTYDINEVIKVELGKKEKEVSVVSIGPAGEHLVRFAGVFAEKGHSASHNGSGAVMGSKRLKAIAVLRGKARVPVKDMDRLARVARKLYDNTKGFTGTIGSVYTNEKSGQGVLPVKNYMTNVWDIHDDDLKRYEEDYIRENFQEKLNPCWACRLLHSTMMRIKEGPYKDTLVEEPEYEQMAAWGPNVVQNDSASAMMLSALTDRLGLENNEAGWLIGWVMECYEKGIFTKEETGGLEMRWGNVEAVRQLLYLIAHRQAFGDLFAEGVMRASQKIGGRAASYAIYTMKGNTPRGHDHRTRWFEMFETCVSNTGTIETGPTPLYLGPTDLLGPENPIDISSGVAKTNGLMQFEDCLGMCRFNCRFNVELEAEAVSAVTGWDLAVEEARSIGLRVVNLLRAYNFRCGITRDMDRPSARYGSTPIDGPSKGKSVMPHWEKMLENYYREMGWHTETGKPLPETLKKLGLEHVTKDIWKSEE